MQHITTDQLKFIEFGDEKVKEPGMKNRLEQGFNGAKMDGDYAGKYYSYGTMPAGLKEDLQNKHLLFRDCNVFMKAAKACTDWPTGRFAWISNDQKFGIWFNRRDHVEIFVLEKVSWSVGSGWWPSIGQICACVFGV